MSKDLVRGAAFIAVASALILALIGLVKIFPARPAASHADPAAPASASAANATARAPTPKINGPPALAANYCLIESVTQGMASVWYCDLQTSSDPGRPCSCPPPAQTTPDPARLQLQGVTVHVNADQLARNCRLRAPTPGYEPDPPLPAPQLKNTACHGGPPPQSSGISD